MILHLLVLKMEEYNIKRVKKIEKMRISKEIKRIEGVREVEKAITKIK